MSSSTYIIEPLVSVGPFKFGMTKSEIDRYDPMPKCEFSYDPTGNLFCIDLLEEPKNLLFNGVNLSKLSAIDAVLAVARHSQNIRQYMGGRLHFFDLGIEIGDWEQKDSRVFSFFNYEEDEYGGTKGVNAAEIIKYYFEGMGYDGDVCDVSYLDPELTRFDPSSPIEKPSYLAMLIIVSTFFVLALLWGVFQ